MVSYILLQAGDTSENNLAITWVEVEPGAKQLPHSHAPEQTYVIVHGIGLMRVGTEVEEVGVGDLVYVPSNIEHNIENIGHDMLIYVSSSVPAFDLEALYDNGQLKSPA